MQFFTVQAVNSINQILLELDVPVHLLFPLCDSIEEYLKKIEYIPLHAHLIKRVVPTYELVETISARFLAEDPPDWDESEYGVYLVGKENQTPASPIQGVSLVLYDLIKKHAWTIDLPITLIFQSAQEYLTNELRVMGVIDETNSLRYFIYFQAEDNPKSVQTPYNSRTLLLIFPTKSKGVSFEPDIKRQPVEIKVTDRRTLIEPILRSWQETEYSLVGSRQRGDLRILLKRQAFDQLWQIADSTSDALFSVGGILLGDLCVDKEQKQFIDISALIAIDMSQEKGAEFLSLRTSPERLRNIFPEIRERGLNKERLGWFYVHLLRPKKSHRFDLPSLLSKRASIFADFTRLEREFHQTFFPEIWQVALIADTDSRLITFYQYRKEGIEPCQGYYLYD